MTAVASYLAARQAGGRWLVRIEDIDPPREMPGAADAILRTLEQLELQWDDTVLYQSTRHDAYREITDTLLANAKAYRCSCTRSELRRRSSGKSAPTRYPGYCRDGHKPGSSTAVRLIAPAETVAFDDALQGHCQYAIDAITGDYVIYRRDGLPAYHLAVVTDDVYQGVTHIVRGVDLLDSTPLHIHLQRVLGLPMPAYAHVPVVVNEREQKLSKQTGAAPIDARNAASAARTALRYLGADPPRVLASAGPAELWQWALEAWSLDTVRGMRHIREHDQNVVENAAIDYSSSR